MRLLRKEMRAASAGGAGPVAASNANVDFQGIRFAGNRKENTTTPMVTTNRPRASVSLRRQYTSQNASTTSASDASRAGAIASQTMPEVSCSSKKPVSSGPGGRTNGVGTTNTQ